MKKCLFYAEDIQDNAIKCKHCGEFLDTAKAPHLEDNKIQWYFRKPFIIIAVCFVGPLELPLILVAPANNEDKENRTYNRSDCSQLGLVRNHNGIYSHAQGILQTN